LQSEKIAHSMAKTIKLTKGFDIQLVGEALRFNKTIELSRNFAIKPKDFKGITPKLLVEQGSEVKAGDPLFYSKDNEKMMFVSPVSGEIAEIKRGERRVIEEIVILSDAKNNYKEFGKSNPAELSKAEIIDKLLLSGAWTFIKQRPFNKIANPDETPQAIFISTFDSSPLGVDYNHVVKGFEKEFQTGIDALKKLTEGNVYLNLSKRVLNGHAFEDAHHVVKTVFDGPHPAGNVGVQIHHLQPVVNKSKLVWTVNPQDLIIIGRLFTEGVFNSNKLVAVAGSSVINRQYYHAPIGVNVSSLLKDNLNPGVHRVISGNVLTGTQINENDYLGYYDSLISVIPEGHDEEFLGWLIPSYPRPSLSKTMPSFLFPDKKYEVNTNMHGEERAFVVTGDYEKVLPMDIMPLHLIKACLTGNFEDMEALGIYEVDPEDFALCEFICTSKSPIQRIINDGLNLIEKEG